MMDIQLLRDQPDLVAEKSKQKNIEVDIPKLLRLDDMRLQTVKEVELLRQKRNENASKMKDGKPEPALIDEGKQIKLELADREKLLAKLDAEWLETLKQIPNMPLDDVPIGASEEENVVSKVVGELPRFEFEPKNHAEIAESKGWLDKERAAKVAGARFAYIKGDLVKLQFALINLVFDKLTDEKFLSEVASENGLDVSTKQFTPILPPYMLRTELYEAMDRLDPRDDRYQIADEDLWLQGSAEHVLGSMHADEIIAESELPLRYIGYATSFRREAGTYGKDMEGIFRMHQFDKLEMESLTLAEHGLNEHLFLIAIQEKLTAMLGIPYQILMKCTADIGKPNARGVDLEMWIPSQNKYRETHTADYMTDYQARRLNTKVRRSNGRLELLHTNDATAFALSRTPIAIIENYQTADGNVMIPDVLQSYIGGRGEI